MAWGMEHGVGNSRISCGAGGVPNLKFPGYFYFYPFDTFLWSTILSAIS